MLLLPLLCVFKVHFPYPKCISDEAETNWKQGLISINISAEENGWHGSTDIEGLTSIPCSKTRTEKRKIHKALSAQQRAKSDFICCRQVLKINASCGDDLWMVNVAAKRIHL
ncbi:hypothetical protein TNIN_492221 [Trichonephila inaurata madagascariensis]|uniref:Uncharacterized protein n=1 Tax=Trichonephila inaurata madagascariensis TaxID=2747483 RepID=A0A8X6KNW9_9ARAC|nr:hypothetical protein TNIN_492221 [Trichonephila inaurata madagascariensis]